MLRTIKKFEVLSTCAKVRDVRQNKGSILKASVDYIKLLRRDRWIVFVFVFVFVFAFENILIGTLDRERRNGLEERCKKLEQNHRRALLKIQVVILCFLKYRVFCAS